MSSSRRCRSSGPAIALPLVARGLGYAGIAAPEGSRGLGDRSGRHAGHDRTGSAFPPPSRIRMPFHEAGSLGPLPRCLRAAGAAGAAVGRERRAQIAEARQSTKNANGAPVNQSEAVAIEDPGHGDLFADDLGGSGRWLLRCAAVGLLGSLAVELRFREQRSDHAGVSLRSTARRNGQRSTARSRCGHPSSLAPSTAAWTVNRWVGLVGS